MLVEINYYPHKKPKKGSRILFNNHNLDCDANVVYNNTELVLKNIHNNENIKQPTQPWCWIDITQINDVLKRLQNPNGGGESD